MKKLLITLLAIIAVLCFAACDTPDDGEVKITGITLDTTEITLTEGEEETLLVTVTPTDATDLAMEWSSSDPSVATVDSGSVTAIAEGEAIITVTTGNGKTATCTVTVLAKQEEPETPTQYSVTFYARGGKFENGKDTYAVQADDGAKLTAVTVTREGKYSFAGWYYDEDLTKLWDFDEFTVNDDTSLYAGWNYISSYQPVTDALADRIKTEIGDDSSVVEILSVFKDSNGYLCFVEKDGTGVFSYATDICNFEKLIDNAGIISQISETNLTKIKDYNYQHNTDNNFGVAYYMAKRYTSAEDIIYGCVTEWEENTEHFTTNGPWYSCMVKAIIVDENGHVFDYSFSVIAGVENFNAVIGGNALSEEYDVTYTELDETADDFYSEWIKEQIIV